MHEMNLNAAGASDTAECADKLFEQHRQEISRNTDRLIGKLMVFQWVGGILIAFYVSPLAWAGQSSQLHIHVWAAIVLGGAISIFPFWLTRVWPGATMNRYVISVAQMLMSVLLIALTGGRIETHFHVFGSLVILSFYRDWRVLIPATIVVGLDHFLRGIYLPYSVYGVLTASPLRSLEHASWVIFEDIFLVISCLRSVHEMRAIAQRTAALREAKIEADRANHAKSEFLSRMSHELRTPLNAIIGFGQLIERQNPTESVQAKAGHIIGGGRHLLNLINEVLDISRLETGNLPLSLEPVCVAEALEEALSLMRPLAAERNIELFPPDPMDRSHYCMADRQRVKQVLLNVLANAVKYTPRDGKVTVSVSSNITDTIRIFITDSGPGLAPEKLTRLFTAFDRLGAEHTAVEGTGLGLALCQRLMHAMQGSIGVNSVVDRGSTFWIELARVESPLERMVSAKRFESSTASDARKLKIIYVEDNLSNLTLVEQILADQPHIELISAMQGLLGIELARKHSPDLILLDLNLPDLDGWDVLSRLQRDGVTREIPVVIISADATAGQIKRLMTAGARAYITKPIDVYEFLKVIDQISASHLTNAPVAV